MNWASYSSPQYSSSPYQPEPDQAVLFELGWKDVRKGLGMILRGWLQILATVALGTFAVFVLFSNYGEKNRPLVSPLGRILGLEITFGLVSLVMLYNYYCLIVGHWRCLMNAPERHWAKWLMYACIICVCSGPIINIAIGIDGYQNPPKIKKGMQDLKDVEVPPAARNMFLAGLALDFLSFLLFMLFLRAVARCFQDDGRVRLVDGYLLLYGLTVVATVFLIFIPMPGMFWLLLGLAVLVAWVLCFIGYLVLVGVAHLGITSGLSRLQSPLVAKRY